MTAPITIPSATAIKAAQVNGGNLFRLALDTLGDALQWNRIASANRLLDPFLPINTQTNLIIPPINFAASGSGVLQPNMGAPTFAPGPASTATLPVAVIPPTIAQIPVNITIPVISGIVMVGQTLTVSDGSWSNNPTAFAYQWRRNGTLVGVAKNYTTVMGDDGVTFTTSVIAVNSVGPSVPAITSIMIPVSSSNITYDFSDEAQSGIQCWIKAA